MELHEFLCGIDDVSTVDQSGCTICYKYDLSVPRK